MLCHNHYIWKFFYMAVRISEPTYENVQLILFSIRSNVGHLHRNSLKSQKKKILRAWPQESNAEQLYMCGAHPPTTRSNPRGLLCNILTFQLLGRLLNQHLNHAQWDARYDEK